MSRWFRHYAGMMRDDKLVRVALHSKQTIERVVWIYGAILESAAEINDGGRYDFDAAEAAHFLHADLADVSAIEASLSACGRVLEGCVTKWSDRQFTSDDSSERVRRHRSKQQSVRNGQDQRGSEEPERYCNENVTLRNAPETETETETEKKEESPSLRSGDISREAFSDDWPSDYRDQFWSKYPRKVGRKAAFRKLEAIRRSGEVTWERLVGGILKIPKNTEQRFIPHPLTWLNRGGWDDEEVQTGGINGHRGSRSLQDDSLSVGRAAERLAHEARQGNVQFAPRPSLLPRQGENDLRLLPAGRSSEP